MLCKYCHLKTHLIDKCPTIICKNCKEVGHPQWLCKDKKNIKDNVKDNVKPHKNMMFEKKYCFTDEIKKKPSEKIVDKNLNNKNVNYYLKLEKEEWGDLITI